jgi:hypothetical protein
MGADETQIEASFCEACFGGNRCPVGPVEPIKMFTQTFDNMMLPPKTHVLGTPNRNPAPRTDRR